MNRDLDFLPQRGKCLEYLLFRISLTLRLQSERTARLLTHGTSENVRHLVISRFARCRKSYMIDMRLY